ncbi:MAG: ASKHA domain-containing protein [Fusobacteriota bacterium]
MKIIYNSKLKNLLEILRFKGIQIESPCNGNGTCGKCKVRIKNGKTNDISENEKERLSDQELKNGVRLACMTKVKSDLEIEILSKQNIRQKKWRNYSKTLIGIMDLGTTSIKIEFYDYETKKLIDRGSFYNPQRKYGYDVLNRITYALSDSDNLKELQEIIIKKINEISLIKKTKKLIVAGNSTMEALFLGLSPKSLTIPPYSAPFCDRKVVLGSKLGLNMKKNGKVNIFPNLSAFVGGDTYSIFNYYMKYKRAEKNILIIDIGTNGELLYIGDDKALITSTAAGPAFEGASLECGMNTNSGALIDIEIGDNIRYKTIENEKIQGISGTGIFALISELLEVELIDNTGKLVSETNLYPNLNSHLKQGRFYIDNEVYISQRDIREIQKSKSAIRSAVDIMSKKVEDIGEEIKKIVITGNFGENLKKEYILTLGLLKSDQFDVIKTNENLVISGLRADMNMKKMTNEKYNYEYINLNKEKEFEEKYIKNLDF